MAVLEKGHQLEEKIEKYFQLNGYKTKRNVIMEGHSGSKHEIDIFAEKSDVVTTVQIIVECKAWDTPIEKDVVSKVHYVLNDIGAHKAIIVSLSGFRVGAKQAAEKLGFELWGREEIKNRIGTVEISKLEVTPFEKTALGVVPKIKPEEAKAVIESKRAKRFGKEEHVFTKLVYVPCYVIRYSYTVKEGTIKSKEVVKTTYSFCEAIEGSYFPLGKSGETINIELSQINIQAPIIAPRVKSAKLRKEVEKAVEEYDKFAIASARARRLMIIERILGPVKFVNIAIDSITEVHYPFYAGMLAKEGRSRWVVVDGMNDRVSEEIGSVFNRNSTYIEKQIHENSCPHCGGIISRDNKFCPRCGSEIIW